MKTFAQRAAEEARLVMLQELARQPNGELPIRMFRDVLEVEGHTYSHDWVRTELSRLEELRLVRLITLRDGVPPHIAGITELGEDVVARRVVVEGVKRPDRGA